MFEVFVSDLPSLMAEMFNRLFGQMIATRPKRTVWYYSLLISLLKNTLQRIALVR